MTVWEIQKGRTLYSFPADRRVRGAGALGAIALNRARKRLATAGNRKINTWSLPGGILVRTFDGHSGGICALAWSSDGNLLASGSTFDDQSIRLWNSRTGKQILNLDGHGMVNCLTFLQGNKVLASAGSDPIIYLWDTKSGGLLGELRGHQLGVTAVSLSPDGPTLASCGEDGRIFLWDVKSRKKTRTLHPPMTCSSIEFSPDGKSFVSADVYEGKIRIWDLAKLRPSTIAVVKGNFASVTYSPSGQLIATTSNALPGMVQVWSIGSVEADRLA